SVEIEAITPSRFAFVGLIRSEVAWKQHAPPSRPPDRAAFVRNDGEKPRLQVGVLADPVELSPGLEGRLLDGILGGEAVFQHRHCQSETWVEHGSQQLIEGAAVTRAGAREPALGCWDVFTHQGSPVLRTQPHICYAGLLLGSRSRARTRASIRS